MKALITGSEGFVGRYLRQELESCGHTVVRADRVEGPGVRRVDLLDAPATEALLEQERPDWIFHLAGQADIGLSWRKPRLTFELNILAALHVLEALRKADRRGVRVVIVGSSDQYGALGADGQRVTEETPLRPSSPYAISKRAQEELAALYAGAYGLSVSMTRSFNHGGAGQRAGFMIPDFASGIVRIERGLQRDLSVGNLAARRDFTHVRDIVRAYRLIAEKGAPGEVYNVGSGVTWSAGEILDRLIALAKVPVPVRQDPARMRPSDSPVICCDHAKLTRDTGWEPELPLDRILTDTLEWFRSRPDLSDC